jgi:hypothetical protein
MRWANTHVVLRLRRVPPVESSAVAALQSLYDEVFADLDAADGGGIRWMRDQLDWPDLSSTDRRAAAHVLRDT